jgi:hypothetical protein
MHDHFFRFKVVEIAKIFDHVIDCRNHIREDFEAFDNAPDTGLLSKSLARFIKSVINYVFKGFFGSALLVTTMSLTCLFCSLSALGPI